ncbi:MAG: DUF2182 domain-containing protein [Gammaproteobacteria bacterium]|nr:DUF2182 domain-containing protein [Gammaproteobacteria bacterium]NIR88954.1 DUF2182 domain-containing protein [Gammaproteobacteria bacterium]NIU05243.1 DUF2182 domain-containing protein [Gammaproteobacteria bacterium]NIV52858.1 hypothetical protein [Gammaproteobacteria bacterium]NIW85154.1 hypothetical protein [Gammaproteobacteria bacterium]
MALLFYRGAMDVLWITGLAVCAVFEKIVPAGHWLGTLAGRAHGVGNRHATLAACRFERSPHRIESAHLTSLHRSARASP